MTASAHCDGPASLEKYLLVLALIELHAQLSAAGETGGPRDAAAPQSGRAGPAPALPAIEVPAKFERLFEYPSNKLLCADTAPAISEPSNPPKQRSSGEVARAAISMMQNDGQLMHAMRARNAPECRPSWCDVADSLTAG